MASERKITLGLIFVLAAAFIVRLSLIIGFKTYAHPVGWEFETIANNLLSGKGYSYQFLNTTYRSFATPLFPFLCAAVYAVTNHSHFAILCIQSAFSIALAITIFLIAKTVFNERVGLLAAGLVAFHPGFIYYDVFNLLPLSIDSFLIAVITLLLLKQQDRPTTLIAMSLIGALIGVGILSRGIIGALLPLVTIYIVLFARSLKIKDRLKLVACVTGSAFIILAPWIIRNYVVQKQFVFIASTSTENFWRGNNVHATGTSYDRHKNTIFDLWPKDFQDRVRSMTEMQQKQFFEREAFDFIRAHPGQAFTLYVKKIYYFWWFSPQSGINYPVKYLLLYKYFYMILLGFSIAGMVLALASRNRNVRSSSLILLFVPLSICLAQSLFYVEGRHRWLVEPIMIIFFSHGVLESWKVIRRKAAAAG